MHIPEHAMVFLINIFFVIPIIIYIMNYYRRKNVEWRDEIKTGMELISKSISILTNQVNNNISSSLLPILYEELQGLSNETKIEKSLWIYFRKKVSDVAESYYTLKNVGIDTLRQHGFASNLLGSGTTELIHLNPDFPVEFTQQIDGINEKHYKDFLDSIFLEFQLNTKDDKMVIIKTVTIEYFRKNVHAIYQLYKDTRHLIKSDDFKKNKNVNKKLNLADTVQIDPGMLKDIISQGTKGVEKVIKLLQILVIDSDKLNDVAIYSARYYDYKQREDLNLGSDPTELNSIRNSLLNLIDSL